jgi:hypothetical protein
LRQDKTMNPPDGGDARWSTASFGGNADTSPMELSALGDHLGRCKQHHGGLFAVRCGVDLVHGFVASRFVTTLAVLTLLIGALLLVF